MELNSKNIKKILLIILIGSVFFTAVQNCTMSSFFLSCAMSVIFITLNSFVHMPESVRRIFISFTRFPCSLFAMCRHARLAP